MVKQADPNTQAKPSVVEAVSAYLALAVDRIADRGSTLCTWTVSWDKIRNTFARFALPITWDFAESVPFTETSGGYPGATSGSTVRLKRWEQRRRKDLGLAVSSRMAPLIDQVHHIMHLWKDGDVHRVDTYLEEQGLRRNPVFSRLLQALIELARKDNQADEVSMLESIMNHTTARGMHPQMRLMHTEESE